MRRRRIALTAFAVLLSAVCAARSDEGRFSGFAGVEGRFFFSDAEHAGQDDSTVSPSLLIQPEYRYEMNERADRFTVVGFARADADDDKRTHFDLREANWVHRADSWDLLVGVGKVFWGVAESRHLVDIINQTDLVENLDEEDKLGQPMVNLNLLSDWGTLGLFVLPRFRERTFPDADARLRGLLPVIAEDATYDSGAEEWHVDFAARWWHTIGDLDIGLAHFSGTGREPRFVAATRGGAPVLVPHYDQIHQTSIDAQYTTGPWLLKLEALTRSGNGDAFQAAVAGFEYTIGGIADSQADLGLLAEYLYDGRDSSAPPTSLENDVFLGARLALNDIESTEILAGAVVDLGDQATFISVEAERRLGQDWKLELELRALVNTPIDDPVAGGVRADDHVLIRLSRFF